MSETGRGVVSYQQLIAVRNAELTTHWTRYNIQIVLNSTVLFGFLALKTELSRPGVVISLGGIFAIIWALINYRGHWWLRYWNEELGMLEKESGLPQVFVRAIKRTQPDKTASWEEKMRSRLMRVAFLSTCVPATFSVTWFCLALSQKEWTVIPIALGLLSIGISIAVLACSLQSEQILIDNEDGRIRQR